MGGLGTPSKNHPVDMFFGWFFGLAVKRSIINLKDNDSFIMKNQNGTVNIIWVVVIILVLVIGGGIAGYILFKKDSKEVQEESEETVVEEISETHNLTQGNSLEVGDYIKLGTYQVEGEGYNPILWIVIDNNNHYSGNVDPVINHITLLSKYIIDIRGFDAPESKNTNEIRRDYGNSRYGTSNIRQWLNSDKEANNWWTAQNLVDGTPGTNNADAAPSDADFLESGPVGYDDKEGFLKSFTADELETIIDTTLVVAKNTITEGSGSETVIDKVFLLSLAEIGLGNATATTEGSVFEFFNSGTSRQATASAQCINNTDSSDKPSSDENWYWWLRSPSSGMPASVYMVGDSGGMMYSPANMCEKPVGVRPALNLKSDLYFSGSGTKDDPYIIKTGFVEEGQVVEKKPEEAVESSEIKNTQIITEDNSMLSNEDKLLQTVCQTAIGDYPEWTRTSNGLVVWEDSEEKESNFFIRLSPDYPTYALQSPARESNLLVGLDFVDENTLGYVTTNQGNSWAIGLLPLNSNNSGTTIVYETTEPISIHDVSFINKDEFLIFYVTKSEANTEKAVLSYINNKNGTEEILSEFNISSVGEEGEIWGTQKVSVSPKGTYVYIIYNASAEKQRNVKIFSISNKKQVDEIYPASSIVWIGDTHLLYSSLLEDAGVFLYDVKNGNSYEITKIDPSAEDLAFCPKSGGVIAYNTDHWSYESNAYAISCKNWSNIDSRTHGAVEALANEDTAIFTKYILDKNNESQNFTVEESGYWRFSTRWALHLSYGFSSFYSRPVLATVWNRY